MSQKYYFDKLVQLIQQVLKFLPMLFVTSQISNDSHRVVRTVSVNQISRIFKGQ